MAVYRPEDLHPATLEALNAGDIDAVIGLYEPGASMTLQPGTFVEGLDGIRDIWNGFLAVNGKMTVEVTKLVQTGDLALSQSNWSVVSRAVAEQLVCCRDRARWQRRRDGW